MILPELTTTNNGIPVAMVLITSFAMLKELILQDY